MAQTYDGNVSCVVHDTVVQHRYEITVTEDDKLLLWIENRESRNKETMVAPDGDQSSVDLRLTLPCDGRHTGELHVENFVTKENAVPMANAHNYAKRFAVCLDAKEPTKYKRSLEANSNDYILILELPLLWAALDFSVKHEFTLKKVSLLQIDILGSRVRDLEERLNQVKANQGVQQPSKPSSTIITLRRCVDEAIAGLADDIQVLQIRADETVPVARSPPVYV